MRRQQQPGITLQPATYRGMLRGIDRLVGAIRPTLGPLPRIVGVERQARGSLPELLDSGGIIARRTIELPDRDEDLCAMYLRGLLWRLHELVGDGTATAAVLFHSLYSQGIGYVV